MNFKTCFDSIKKSLPVELVNAHYKKIISAIVPPINFFSLASIECKLDSDDPGVDLAIGFENLADYRWTGVFADMKLSNHTGIPGDDHFPLENILNWFATSNPKNHFLLDQVQGLWLNFDLSTGMELQVPWSYIVFRNSGLGLEFDEVLLQKTVESMSFEFDAPTMGFMKRSILNLPSNAYLLGLALPTSRNAHAYRLVIYGMNFNQLVEYLERIQWAGQVANLCEKLESLGNQCDQIGLLLDFSPGGMKSKIGIELLIDQQNADSHSRNLLDGILELGIGDKVKINALKRWLDSNCDPTWEAAEMSNKPMNKLSPVRQWINHFKIVFNPGTGLSAKCYLGIQPT